MATTDTLLKYMQQRQQMQKPDYGVLGAGVGALGALMSGNTAHSNLGSSISSLQAQEEALAQQQGQMPSLAAMYGPDSPYAQQLAQTLARQDAKAGRNSQYGPRSVELQARLAEKGSQYASQQAQSMRAYQEARQATQQARAQAQQQQQQIRGQQLASLFNVADKSGMLKPINQAIDRGLGGLYDRFQGLFGGGDEGFSPDFSLSNLPDSGRGQGFDMTYTNPDNPYSLQTGMSQGMSNTDPNALMPQWNSPAPSGGGGDPWAWLDNQ